MEADAVADLAQLPDIRIRKLKMERMSAGPTIRVEITPLSRTIMTLHPGNETRGIAHRAADVLRRRRRPTQFWVRVAVAILAVVAGAILGYAGGSGIVESLPALVAAFTLAGSTAIAIPFLAGLDRSVVIARRRAESPSFFQRNRDQLGVGVVLSLVSGAVGFILGRLT